MTLPGTRCKCGMQTYLQAKDPYRKKTTIRQTDMHTQALAWEAGGTEMQPRGSREDVERSQERTLLLEGAQLV